MSGLKEDEDGTVAAVLAKKGVASKRGLASTPPGEGFTAHWRPLPLGTGRDRVVRHLGYPQPRDVETAPPRRGIELVDLAQQDPGALIERLVCEPRISLARSALVLNGYWVWAELEFAALELLEEIRLLEPEAERIFQALEWLEGQFPGPKRDSSSRPRRRKARYRRITPDELMTALSCAGSPPSIFPMLVWNAYRIATDRLVQPIDDLLEPFRQRWHRELDNGMGATNQSRSALYLLAVDAGHIRPGRGFHASISRVQAALKRGLEKVQEVHDERRAPEKPEKLQFRLPSNNPLTDWLRAGAEAIGFDPAERVTRKRK